mmetsp:Transcript_9366/g.36434  ORF Transcript_9366/g.36434 Transcript_9366/m.36434 type:complete len:223 (-) Transcript_9366:578-1246(-)
MMLTCDASLFLYSRRPSSSACWIESFTPASRVYSNVTLRPVAMKYCCASSRSSWMGYALALGMSRSLSSWLGACREMASVDWSLARASLSIAPLTPTVDMVMCLDPMPTSLLSASCALSTFGTLSRGSPMPMNTMCVTRSPKCSSRLTTWSTISCVARLRANPPFPVAQNVHRIGHPTCEETHAVSLLWPASCAGIPTVSTTLSSWSLRRSLVVPSGDPATW